MLIVAKVMAMVIVNLSFAYIDERKTSKSFEGFKQLTDESGNPLNEWVPIDYAE